MTQQQLQNINDQIRRLNRALPQAPSFDEIRRRIDALVNKINT